MYILKILKYDYKCTVLSYQMQIENQLFAETIYYEMIQEY